MKIDAFIRSLPHNPERALMEIEGAMQFADDLSPEDRQALVTARAEAQRRTKGFEPIGAVARRLVERAVSK